MADRYDDTLILGYLEGELSDADRVKLERQMASDPALATLVERMRGDRAGLRRLPVEDPPVGLSDAAMSLEERSMLLGDPDSVSVRAPDSPVEEVRRFRLRRTMSYLAIAALVCICGAVVLISLSDPWLPSSSPWLNNTGSAMDDGEPGSTLALEESAARPVPPTAESLPSSGELLAEVFEERRSTRSRSFAGETFEPFDDSGSADFPERKTLKPLVEKSEIAASTMAVAPASKTMDRGLAMRPAPETVSEPALVEGLGKTEQWSKVKRLHALDALVRRPNHQARPVNTLSVEIDTEDPRQTRVEIDEWAITNRALIESPRNEVEPVLPTGFLAARSEAELDRPTEQSLSLLINDRQVSQLLIQLNALPQQRAKLVGEYSRPADPLDMRDTVVSALDEVARLFHDSAEPSRERSSSVGSLSDSNEAFMLPDAGFEAFRPAKSRELANPSTIRLGEALRGSSESEPEFPVRVDAWNLIDAADYTTRVEVRIKPVENAEASADMP